MHLLATFAGVSTALAARTAYAGISAGDQLFGPTLVAPPLPQQLALTFDDGPNPTATPRLLDVLASRNVRATFFLIGSFVLKEPALVRRIEAEGHRVGNHTMNHRYLPILSERRIREELSACNHALEDTLGRPVTLFRPPHGARRPAVMRAARELGLETVQWNLIVGDWNPVPAETIYTRIARGMARNRRRGQGTNVVLHDGGQGALGQPRLPTVEAVERLLDHLAADTIFVTPPDWA